MGYKFLLTLLLCITCLCCIQPALAQKGKGKPTAKKKAGTVVRKTSPARSGTAAAVKMSTRELKMIDEINLVRSNPKAYIPFIKNYLVNQEQTASLQDAADELIEELKKLKPMSRLKPDAEMYKAARQFGVELMKKNRIEHSALPYAENLSFGVEDVREAVISLLIDEDIEGRGHRRNILTERFSKVAVHELPGEVEGFNHCYVQEFK